MIYFTSDTHFYHNNIVQLCDRPFRDYDEMHRTLVLNWNSMVRDTDEIYILGDFIHKGNGEEANKILKKLKGKKYLIRGNHDKYLEDIHFDQNLFIWVKDYYVLNYKKIKFIFNLIFPSQLCLAQQHILMAEFLKFIGNVRQVDSN